MNNCGIKCFSINRRKKDFLSRNYYREIIIETAINNYLSSLNYSLKLSTSDLLISFIFNCAWNEVNVGLLSHNRCYAIARSQEGWLSMILNTYTYPQCGWSIICTNIEETSMQDTIQSSIIRRAIRERKN